MKKCFVLITMSLIISCSSIKGPGPNKHLSVSENGRYLMVYLAKGQPVDVIMVKINDVYAVAWWFKSIRNQEIIIIKN